MKLYVQKGTAVNNHRVREYATSKKACATIRDKWRKIGIQYGNESVPIDKIEKEEVLIIPYPNTYGIVEFLNKNTPRVLV